MSAMAADQRLRIAQASASKEREVFLAELELKFAGFLRETDVQSRKNILFLASMSMRRYLGRLKWEHTTERSHFQHVNAACIAVGYAFAASSVEEFRLRMSEYSPNAWERVPE